MYVNVNDLFDCYGDDDDWLNFCVTKVAQQIMIIKTFKNITEKKNLSGKFMNFN